MGPELSPSALLLGETWGRSWLPGPDLTDTSPWADFIPPSVHGAAGPSGTMKLFLQLLFPM